MKQSIEGIIKQLVNEVVCELVGSYDDENSRLAEAEENALSAIAKIRVEELPKEWVAGKDYNPKNREECWMAKGVNNTIADARGRIR